MLAEVLPFGAVIYELNVLNRADSHALPAADAMVFDKEALVKRLNVIVKIIGSHRAFVDNGFS